MTTHLIDDAVAYAPMLSRLPAFIDGLAAATRGPAGSDMYQAWRVVPCDRLLVLTQEWFPPHDLLPEDDVAGLTVHAVAWPEALRRGKLLWLVFVDGELVRDHNDRPFVATDLDAVLAARVIHLDWLHGDGRNNLVSAHKL